MVLYKLLLAVFIGLSTSANPDPCPIDYEYRPEDHRCIKFFPVAQEFWAADAACRKDGGHLISIHNGFDNNMAVEILNEYGGGVSWIGFYRNSSNGEFYWTDLTPTNYNKWAANNPHPGDHAAVFAGSSWQSAMATVAHPFLCEKLPSFVPCTNMTVIVPACADGWTVNTHFQSCYQVGHAKTWSDAKNACAAANAQLVTFTSNAEQTFVNGLASSGIIGDKFYQTWVGAFQNNGQWRWINGSPVANTVHSLSSDGKPQCAALMTDSLLFQSELASVDCAASLRAYVCKTNMKSQ